MTPKTCFPKEDTAVHRLCTSTRKACGLVNELGYFGEGPGSSGQVNQ